MKYETINDYEQKLKGLLHEVLQQSLELQWEIERLPASTQQTDVSVKAHELRKKLIDIQTMSGVYYKW